MSNQRPTDDEIRKRLEMYNEAIKLSIASGTLETDEALAILMTTEHALRWVLGEENNFEGFYRPVTSLVRSSEAMQQQNYRDN